MSTTVHNLSQEKMREGDVYIGRKGHGHDGYFGNPYQIGEHVPGYGNLTRRQAIELFEITTTDRLTRDPEFRARVAALRGKRLFCFCAPAECHGDVLAGFAEGLETAAPS